LYPAYWADGDDAKTIGGCKDGPQPANQWDRVYWCGTFTDYHNTVATAPIWAFRSGEIDWLEEIAFPGALRQLFTQIFQCAPEDRFFYCGQSPTGYSAYRADANSSHAYFDNLFLYYYLTGDRTVVDTSKRGAVSMRRHLCAKRPAAPCSA